MIHPTHNEKAHALWGGALGGLFSYHHATCRGIVFYHTARLKQLNLEKSLGSNPFAHYSLQCRVIHNIGKTTVAGALVSALFTFTLERLNNLLKGD